MNGTQNNTNTKGKAMQLTDEQIELMARFIADYNGGSYDEYLGEPIELTRDAFDSFPGIHWAEAEGMEDDDDFGVPARYFSRVQVAKGRERVQLWVMDFGDFRAVYTL